MPLCGTGGRGSQGWIGTVAAHQQVGNRRIAGGGQMQSSTPRTNRDDDVLGGGCAQDPHRAWGGFLDGLEQGVGSTLGDAIGVLDDDDLTSATAGAHRCLDDEVAYLLDRDRQGLGTHHRHVGVRPGQNGMAGIALPTAAVVTLQGGGKGPGGVGTSRSRRSGEQPSMAHGVWLGRYGPAQHTHRVLLTDEVGPHPGEQLTRLAGRSRFGVGTHLVGQSHDSPASRGSVAAGRRGLTPPRSTAP